MRKVWVEKMGQDILSNRPNKGMGAEDYPFFTTEPYIPSVYFTVGGTPDALFAEAEAGGSPVPSHHSPLFKITPKPAVTSGVEATVTALLDLMPKQP